MVTVLAFLLFLQAGEPVLDRPSAEHVLERQLKSYFQHIARDENLSESLWSLAQIYLENEEYRRIFFAVGETEEAEWIHLLDRDEPDPDSFHRLALHFEDEYLHLYLHLQIYPEELRPELYADFYEHTGSDRLRELNRSIAESGSLPADFTEQTEWDFSIFLTLFHTGRLDLPGGDFFEKIAKMLETMKADHLPDSSMGRDYLYASLFRTHYRLNHFHAIAGYYEELATLESIPDGSPKRNLYRALDFALYRAGHIDRSLEVQRTQTIPLTERLGERSTLNEILSTHGGYLYSIGRFREARRAFSTALTDTAHLNPAIQTRLLNNLSLVYFKLGEYNRYIETQMEAHAFAVEQENHSHQLSIYRNLHIYYRKNQNWNLALQYIDEAQEIAERAGDRDEFASIIISKAVYFDQFLGDSEQAFQLLDEAEELMADDVNYRLHVRLLSEKADLFKRIGEPVQSREIFGRVLEIGAENQNDRVYLGALVDLADTELQIGNPERAAAHLLEFNAHDVSLVDFPVLVNARRVEAEIAFRQNRIREAERLISMVYEQVLEWARNTTDIEAGYWHVEQTWLHLFQLYAELLEQQGRFEDLANVLDQLKTINDAALIDNPLVQSDLLTEGELSENRRINQRLDQLRKQSLVVSDSERLLLQNEIATLNAQKNRLSRERTTSLFRPVNLWTVRSQLSRGEMILHTTRILDRLYLLLIDRQNITQRTMTLDQEQERLFERAIRGLTSGQTNLEELHAIYSWLQLDRIPSRIRSLIVVPDSYLYQLPLDILPVSPPQTAYGYGSAEYLIERMDIRYLNSLQELFRRAPGRSFQYDFTGIGISDFSHTGDANLVPLPGAAHEVQRIANGLAGNGNTRTMIGREGTPQRFRESASSSRILHLASHSMVSDNDPLFSRIYLHPGQGNSGEDNSSEIFAYQLFDMNLNSELIMFNSCDSGSGDYFQGTGVMGLSRALRYAGARSLILNSWAVNDQYASEFAVELYRHVGQGKGKSEALREAKIHFLTNHNANPHFWGAYVLNGDPRPVFRQPADRRTFALLSTLFAGLLLLTHLRLTRHPSRPA